MYVLYKGEVEEEKNLLISPSFLSRLSPLHPLLAIALQDLHLFGGREI